MTQPPAHLGQAVLRRYRLLDATERRRGLGLLAAAICTTGLEWMGGASMFAFVALLARPEALVAPPALEPLLRRFGSGPDGVRVAVVAAMGAFHLTRIAILLALTRVRARLRGSIGSSLSGRLVEAHLEAPLDHHERRNSGERMHDVTQCAPAVWQTLDAAVYLATEACVVLGLLALLAALRPFEVLATGGTLVLFVAATLRMTRRAGHANGLQTRAVEGRSLRALQQLYGAWREVKVLGREGHFHGAFLAGRAEALRLKVREELLAQAPRSLLEAGFVLGACALALFTTAGPGGAAEAFPVLGLYGYTGFRAVPAVERILGHLAHMRWTVAMTEAIVPELEAAERARPVTQRELPFVDRVRLEQVAFGHLGAETTALDGVDLEIPRGSSLAIVGRTGAGKSTLLDILLGLRLPQQGQVRIDLTPLGPETLRAWRRRLGYVPQAAFVLDDSVRRNVAFGVADAAIDDARVWEALRLARAADFVAALPQGLDTFVGERGGRLSGGERQRLAIARALFGDPELLCLDEATAALDPATERELTAGLASRPGRTLVMITHRMATARRCDRVAVLAAGRVVACGPWDALLASSPELRELAELAAHREADLER